MKLYEIPKGTEGKLIIQEPNGVEVREWITRKDLAFSETLLDPVRLHNNRGAYDHSSLAVKLVYHGYALFAGSFGNVASAKYVLAVPYDEVHVMS